MLRPVEPVPPRSEIGWYYWHMDGPDSWLGWPTCYSGDNPDGAYTAIDGKGTFMRYQEGWIYGARSGHFTPMRNGEILRRWAQLGGEAAELRYPKTEETSVTLESTPRLVVRQQIFEGGRIYSTDDGRMWGAVALDGASLPRVQYTLSLDSVRCNEESGMAWIGSDDVMLRLVRTTSGKLAAEATKAFTWRNKTLDTGDEVTAAIPLYQGWLPDTIIRVQLF